MEEKRAVRIADAASCIFVEYFGHFKAILEEILSLIQGWGSGIDIRRISRLTIRALYIYCVCSSLHRRMSLVLWGKEKKKKINILDKCRWFHMECGVKY
jgi:hypothetical protein